MATSIIPMTTNSDSGKFKTPDGFLMKWQSVSIPSGQYAMAFYLGGEFTEIDTVMVSTDVNDVTTFINATTTNQISVGRRPITTECTLRCLAIGRWK